MNSSFKHPLGAIATDAISGSAGTIISRTDYITGPPRYGLQPRSEAGKFEGELWLDEDRLICHPDQKVLTLPVPPSDHAEGDHTA